MTVDVKYPYAQVAVFLWIGFVCAISFMEAWLKFSAPGITVPLGLGIGQLVFGALNIMEWIFAIVVLTNLFLSKGKTFDRIDFLYFIPLFFLFLQTVWLLPALGVRADAIIRGMELPSSNLHFVYVGLEITKVACLFLFGIKLYRK